MPPCRVTAARLAAMSAGPCWIVEPGRISGAPARLLALLATVAPYPLAARLAGLLLGVSISPMGIWRVAQRLGEAAAHRTDALSRYHADSRSIGAPTQTAPAAVVLGVDGACSCAVVKFWISGTRMRYDEYLRMGYGIGSGAVESAHKQVVHARFRQAGMRWSEAGARRLLALRLLLLNQDWALLDRLRMVSLA